MTVPMTHENGPQETFNVLGATANGVSSLPTIIATATLHAMHLYQSALLVTHCHNM